MRREQRQIARRLLGPDHRGLMDNDVDAVEQPVVLLGRAQVDHGDAIARRTRAGAVRLLDHRVEPDDVVPAGRERVGDRAADEARRAGDQHPHGSSNGSVRPSSACAQSQPVLLDVEVGQDVGEHAPQSRRCCGRTRSSTSAWVTASPPSTPASRSVTSATVA